eukprot:3039391-Rhodomonas_salina.1
MSEVVLWAPASASFNWGPAIPGYPGRSTQVLSDLDSDPRMVTRAPIDDSLAAVVTSRVPVLAVGAPVSCQTSYS